jgi:micrococcal nuclease
MKQLLLIILIFINFACFGTPIKVIRIIDGDTFETETGEKVRLIGINAPEIRDIFGEEAKQHLINLVENKIVDLEPDHISHDRDRYNRLLRYVILNGIDINKQMVLDGYAFAYLKYHFDKGAEYKEAQIIANRNNAGMWNNSKNNDSGIIKQQRQADSRPFKYISSKIYLIGTLMLLLFIIGCYYYFKK